MKHEKTSCPCYLDSIVNRPYEMLFKNYLLKFGENNDFDYSYYGYILS